MSDTVSGGVYPGEGPGALADGTSPLTQPYSYLPWPAGAILANVSRFQMLTASQLRRLHYKTGTQNGKEIRARRHLARLTKLGMVRRFWGVYDRPEYIYVPASSKARTANMHTLDIAELYTGLSSQRSLTPIQFDPEPWCHVRVGDTVLKPDAALHIGRSAYYIEADRGTEFRSVLAQKMHRYESAFEYRWKVEGAEGFPLVVFVAHGADRKRFIERIIKSQSEPRLFTCVLFSEAAQRLT